MLTHPTIEHLHALHLTAMAQASGQDRRAEGQSRRTTLLRWAECRGDGDGPEGVARNGHARLEAGEGVGTVRAVPVRACGRAEGQTMKIRQTGGKSLGWPCSQRSRPALSATVRLVALACDSEQPRRQRV